jgi:hypothetical protein
MHDKGSEFYFSQILLGNSVRRHGMSERKAGIITP